MPLLGTITGTVPIPVPVPVPVPTLGLDTLMATTSSTPVSSSGPESTSFLTNLLSSRLRITTLDERQFVGHFLCTDSDVNIILGGTEEIFSSAPAIPPSPLHLFPLHSLPHHPSLSPPPAQQAPRRYIGLAIIPGRRIAKIDKMQIEASPSTISKLAQTPLDIVNEAII